MSFGPIQMLNVVVDPTTVAFLTDDGLQGQTPPGEPGSSGGGLDSGGTLDPRTGRYVRNGGSGTRYQTTKTLPHAVNDSLTTSIGSSFSDVDVLANDTYVGTPSIIILDYPVNGTARVVGTGAASRIRYTPPTTGGQVGDTVRYRLRATGNARGSGVFNGPDTAQLFVNVTADTFPADGTYPTTANSWRSQEGDFGLRVSTTLGALAFADTDDGPYPPPTPEPGVTFLLLGDTDFGNLETALLPFPQSVPISPPVAMTFTIAGTDPSSGAYNASVTIP